MFWSNLLVNNQLDLQLFFCIHLFHFFTCFEQSCAHHQENQLYQYDIWYMPLYVGDHLVCRFWWNSSIQTCIPDSHLHRVTYTVWHAGLDGTVPSKPAYQMVTYIQWHIPDVILIKFILLIMSTGVLETCTEVK